MNRIIFIASVLIVSLSIVIGSLFMLFSDKNTTANESPLTEVIQKVRPAVVSISATKTDETGTTSRDGTGIIIDTDGIILTSKHLLETGWNYIITLDDGTHIPAKLYKIHPTLDIALLAIEETNGKNLSVGKFISSQALLQVGQNVISIGNMLGLYPGSVSTGIISGLDRTVSFSGLSMDGLVQTDIPMVLGNSGGPLIYLNGTIIGINVGIVGGTSQIGWTLPLTQEVIDTFINQ